MFRKKKQEADWASIVEHLSGLEPKRMDRLVEIAKDMRTNKHNLDVFINGRPDEVDRLEKGLKEAK